MVLAAALLACVQGCTFKNPQDLDDFGRRFIGLVQSGEFDSALTKIDFAASESDLRALLLQAHDAMISPVADSIVLLGSNVILGATFRAGLSYETKTRSGWMIINLELAGSRNSPRVIGFRWVPTSVRQADVHRFSMNGRRVIDYLFLCMWSAAVIVSLAGAWLAFRTRRGFGMVVFCLIGFTKATLNWSSGHLAFQMLGAQLLGIGAKREGEAGPWLISVSLPIGAILMIINTIQRRRVGLKPAA